MQIECHPRIHTKLSKYFEIFFPGHQVEQNNQLGTKCEGKKLVCDFYPLAKVLKLSKRKTCVISWAIALIFLCVAVVEHNLLDIEIDMANSFVHRKAFYSFYFSSVMKLYLLIVIIIAVQETKSCKKHLTRNEIAGILKGKMKYATYLFRFHDCILKVHKLKLPVNFGPHAFGRISSSWAVLIGVGIG